MARRPRRNERAKIDATPPWDTSRHRPEPAATTGPYDIRDEPDDGVERVDLGALRVPVRAGFDLRVDVNEHQHVTAATLSGPDGTMQLGVFAAPRNEGIWDEVRGEIADSLRSQRGTPKDRDGGPWGTELVGNVRDERNQPVPVRFVGVDGPRWFLRAMLVGPVAVESAAAEAYEDLLRSVVVVRGNEPLPVREPVPLRLPSGVDLPTPE